MLKQFSRRVFLGLSAISALAVASCGSSDPLGEGASATAERSDTIVIGSQDYYSNEIIAEIYAQALEDAGYQVDRQFRIQQREVYMPEIEAGAIDLFPEYTGPLLQYWNSGTTARGAEAIYQELAGSTPAGLRVLDQSSATDQDSYVVTEEFATKWGLATIGDLTKVTEPLTLGANSEGETRPYGPQGLKDAYGVTVQFTPIEDSGGPLTVKALKDGDIHLAIIYTADPSISTNQLVSLTDPESLFLSSHVVPLASDNVDDRAAGIINAISAAMTPEDLVSLNSRSVNEQLPAATIAGDWLSDKNLSTSP